MIRHHTFYFLNCINEITCFEQSKNTHTSKFTLIYLYLDIAFCGDHMTIWIKEAGRYVKHPPNFLCCHRGKLAITNIISRLWMVGKSTFSWKHWKSIANRRVEDWKASNVHTKETTRPFHGPWHDPVGEHMSAQPFSMWKRLNFQPCFRVSQICQRRKSDAN